MIICDHLWPDRNIFLFTSPAWETCTNAKVNILYRLKPIVRLRSKSNNLECRDKIVQTEKTMDLRPKFPDNKKHANPSLDFVILGRKKTRMMIIADIQFPPLLLPHLLPDSGMFFPNFFFFFSFVCLLCVTA